MKNTILLTSALLLAAMSITSCKKDYTCKCTKTYTSSSGSTTTDYSIYTYRENRNKAETRCGGNESTGTDLGGDYTINCDIK